VVLFEKAKNKKMKILKEHMAISLRKIDQSDHEFSCFDGKDKGKGKGKVI
jgi:hypothetical protein